MLNYKPSKDFQEFCASFKNSYDDKEGTLPLRINLEDVFYQQKMTTYWENFLFQKIKEHVTETNSFHSQYILDNWHSKLPLQHPCLRNKL